MIKESLSEEGLAPNMAATPAEIATEVAAEKAEIASSAGSVFDRKMMQDIEMSTNPYRHIDERRKQIYENLKEKFAVKSRKSIMLKSERKQNNIEQRLEDTAKRLGELLAFGDELVTNIKVANEKRELLRRDYEHTRREELRKTLNAEAADSLEQFKAISERWPKLKTVYQPVALSEELEKQKEHIGELMQAKDNIIALCQQEIERISAKYYGDQEKQSSDTCCLIERIDSKIELIKMAYKEHINLLENTLNDERMDIALAAANKWNSFYKVMSDNEDKKFAIAKEKENFYAHEIEKVTAKQEEITRSTRIRLEKDAEMLEWELCNIKNNILMNSEKLDYNYQVLQKRNEENVVINNQQKRRVAKVNELISSLKRKIQASSINTENTVRRLTNDIQKLHSSISELEKKSQQFRINNRKKFSLVWDINFMEIKTLILKVSEIDRILHEQQLSVPWLRPNSDFENIMEAPAAYNALRRATILVEERRNSNKDGKKKDKTVNIRLLRDILRNISERAGFLVEAKLKKVLEDYTAEEKCLVRIDNIFNALQIKDIQIVSKLTTYFEQYAWCPNCSHGISAELLNSVYAIADSKCLGSVSDSVKRKANLFIHKPLKQSGACANHYLIVEPALVLTSLNEFVSQQSTKKRHQTGLAEHTEKAVNLIKIDNETIEQFWRKFSTYMPSNKEKLWTTLEHGLNHFLEVLKQRALLNNECVFLKRQNVELKYLLQKFQV